MAVQHQGAKFAAFMRPRIQPDAVGTDAGFGIRRVAVNNHLVHDAIAGQEFFTDGQKIGRILVADAAFGINTGMNEKEVAAQIGKLEPFQKFQMVGRYLA